MWRRTRWAGMSVPNQLDAPVLAAAFLGLVRGDRGGEGDANREESRLIRPMVLNEFRDHGLGASL